MSGWSSTSLRLAERNCPRALDHMEAKVPYDREIFAVGVSAHAVLEDLGKASAERKRYLEPEEVEEVSQRTCEGLIRDGRNYLGEMEPPLPSDLVWQGRDLALSYQSAKPLAYDLKYEIGIAVNCDWIPCPYGRGAWLRALVDAVGTREPAWWDEEDGDAGGPVLLVKDYKSAWSAREPELRSIQRKIQAVLSWILWGKGHEVLRLVVVNFRLQREYELTILPNTPEGAAVLEQWKRDIISEVEAREKQKGPDGLRPASPGPRCFGCPYLHACDPAKDYLGSSYDMTTRDELARTYSVVMAAAKSLERPLRIATAESPIMLDGMMIGSIAKEQTTLKDNAAERLAQIWIDRTKAPDLETAQAQLPGLFKIVGLLRSNAEKFLKHFYKKDKDQIERRERILEEISGIKIVQKFGIHRSDGEDSAEESL